MKAVVTILPKPSVLDPQGAAAAEAMKHLGLEGVGRVRIGKVVEIQFAGTVDEARLHAVANDLLANPVVEDYTLSIEA